MRAVLLSLTVLIGGGYLAGTQGLLPPPLSHTFESDYERETRLRREWVARQVADAKAGDAEAQFFYAVRSLQDDPDPDDWDDDFGLIEHDPEAAVTMLEASAAQGHSLARQALALVHLDGTLVETDKQIVVDLYTALADGGNAGAMGVVGRLYDRGWSVAQDDDTAAQYLVRASERGIAHARYRLFDMLKEDRLPEAYQALVKDMQENRAGDVGVLENEFNLARLERRLWLPSIEGTEEYWKWSADLDSAVTFWTEMGHKADAEGFSIVFRADARAQEEFEDLEQLAWQSVLETLDPYAKKGRAKTLAAEMTAERVAEAKTLADTAIQKWTESRKLWGNQ